MGNHRDSRADLARFFVTELLGSKAANKRLPLRRYDLGVLLRQHQFPSDPEDGIAAVQVTELRLSAVDSNAERITLECRRPPPHSIWQMRWMSLVEAAANVLVGFVLAVLTQVVLFPILGLVVSVADNVLIGGVFTAVSLARSYTLRRLFERLRSV